MSCAPLAKFKTKEGSQGNNLRKFGPLDLDPWKFFTVSHPDLNVIWNTVKEEKGLSWDQAWVYGHQDDDNEW